VNVIDKRQIDQLFSKKQEFAIILQETLKRI